MTRYELEHIIRASAGISDDTHIVIVGSQAILGQYPHAPKELLGSTEADVYPKHRPEDAVVIDGAIGEMSPFHQSFGYYAHGVGEDTATLPAGWRERTVAVCNENTRGCIGECPEAHDLAVSKLWAGREKDLDFVRVLLDHRLVSADTLGERIGQVDQGGEAARELMRTRLRSILARQTHVRRDTVESYQLPPETEEKTPSQPL